jgi:hypothetical protein
LAGLSTGAIGILGKTPRQQSADRLFFKSSFFRGNVKMCENKHTSFFEAAVTGRKIMLRYSHHEGAPR